jgi:hypothetical protein
MNTYRETKAFPMLLTTQKNFNNTSVFKYGFQTDNSNHYITYTYILTKSARKVHSYQMFVYKKILLNFPSEFISNCA